MLRRHRMNMKWTRDTARRVRAVVVSFVLVVGCTAPAPNPALPKTKVAADARTPEDMASYMSEMNMQLAEAKAEAEEAVRARAQERALHAEQLERVRQEEQAKREILAKERADAMPRSSPSPAPV